MLEKWQLLQRQSLPLEEKILMAQRRIKQWHEYWDGKVYISFSGGKDSTVLLYLVRDLYPDTEAVYVDTGLEFPEIREHVKTIENVVWLKPKMPFNQVLAHYGYPVVSKEVSQKIHEIRTTKSDKLRNKRLHGDEKGNGKLPKKWLPLIDTGVPISHQCCNVMKKRPIKKYEKETGNKPIVGTMASESSLRMTNYLKNGCNNFANRGMSAPLSTWLEKDIWDYLHSRNIPYSSIYNMGYGRTGCVFCSFGLHLEKRPHRFDMLKRTHPKLFSYCMDGPLKMREVLEEVYGKGILEPWKGEDQ